MAKIKKLDRRILLKENELMRKFIRKCRDFGFYKTGENFLSETQLATRVSDDARYLIDKIMKLEKGE